MTPIAPHIAAFLNERLPLEKRASPHTRATYAYAFQLLLNFVSERLKISPSSLQIEQIDAPMVLRFLEHLERDRSNGPRARNARLAAIRSFMRFLEHRVPSALDQIRRILAIPQKKADERLVDHLRQDEMEAILNAPDATTREGIRDRAMLYVGFTMGLRVSELVGLRVTDVSFQPVATILVRGKGRHERSLPLWNRTAAAIRAWFAVRGDAAAPELFLNARGQNLTRAGFEYILDKYVKRVAEACPSLLNKRVSPHVLRHTCAMNILRTTSDLRHVALWLGHASLQTTEIYTRPGEAEKLDVIAATRVPKLRRGRFQPPDALMATLKAASLCGAKAWPSRRGEQVPTSSSA